MKTKTCKFWIQYEVEGKVKDTVSIQPTIEEAKQDLIDLYGRDVTVKFLEVKNMSDENI